MDKRTQHRMISPDANCPHCSHRIHWSCHGKTGYAHCAQSPTATRLIIIGTTPTFCYWEGKCKRRPDGKVEIFYIEEAQ